MNPMHFLQCRPLRTATRPVGRPLVAPVALLRVVGAVRAVEAAEQARQIFRVLEALLDNDRCVGVVQDVLLEPALVAQHVVDEAAQESDIRAGADAHEDVAQR